jgi:hypothetical protein
MFFCTEILYKLFVTKKPAYTQKNSWLPGVTQQNRRQHVKKVTQGGMPIALQ